MPVDPNQVLRTQLKDIADAADRRTAQINRIQDAATEGDPGLRERALNPDLPERTVSPDADQRVVMEALRGLGVGEEEATRAAHQAVQTGPENSRDAARSLIDALDILMQPRPITPLDRVPEPRDEPEPPEPTPRPLPDERESDIPPEFPELDVLPEARVLQPARTVPSPAWVEPGQGLTMVAPPGDNLEEHRREVQMIAEAFGTIVTAYLKAVVQRNARPNTLWWQGVATRIRRTSADVLLDPFPGDPSPDAPIAGPLARTRRVPQGFYSGGIPLGGGRRPTVEVIFVPVDATGHYIYGVQAGPPVIAPVPPRPPNPKPIPPGPPPRVQTGRWPPIQQPEARPGPEPVFTQMPYELPEIEPREAWDGTYGDDPLPPEHLPPPPRPPKKPVRRPAGPAPPRLPAQPEPPYDEDEGLQANFEGYVKGYAGRLRDETKWYLRYQIETEVDPLTRFWTGAVLKVNVASKTVRVQLRSLTPNQEGMIQMCGFGIRKWTEGMLRNKEVRVRRSMDGRYEIDDLL
jgi:hypothetical protein